MTSKLTANSLVFLFLTAFTVGVAFIFRHPLLIYTAVFLVTTHIVLFIWSQRSIGGLHVMRRLPRLAVADHPAEVELELHNSGGSPRFGLLGYDLHGKLTPGQDYSPVAFLNAGAGRTAVTKYSVVPQRSGRYQIGPFYLYGGDPFGFYKNWRQVAAAGELMVLPNPVSFRLPRQYSASRLALDEMATVAMPGESTEFMGVREYRPGEPLKRLHWPTTARLGRLISRQYEMNVSASISTLLVMEPAMLRGGFADNPKEYALRMIAGLGRGTITDNYQFSYLRVTGSEAEASSGSGYNYYQALAMRLAQIDGAAQPQWAQARRAILHYLPQRSTLIVFLATLDGEARLWLRQLAAHFAGLNVVHFDHVSFERGQRPPDAERYLAVTDGYAVHNVYYRDDLSRVLGQVLARTVLGGGGR